MPPQTRVALFIVAVVYSSVAFAKGDAFRQRTGFSSGMREYETKLIELALEETKEKYGPYTHEVVYDEVSISRVWREIERGKTYQLALCVNHVVTDVFDNIETFELPQERAVLGLRKIIIQQESDAKYSQVKSIKEFKKMYPGQPTGWSDGAIYENAGIKVVYSDGFDQLFSMLDGARFSYIPLGLIEIDKVFEEKSATFNDFTISDNTFIYYPLKFHVHYTKSESVAPRLREGLQAIFENGKEEKLFNRLFMNKFDEINRNNASVFVLDNPNYSKDENQQISQQFIKYFKLQDVVHYLEN